ncbi:transposase, partial [Roseateles sp.]|uniref:transposase n=1 Tax=Roseateles sp. TaxID=1971397 RepID=UPI0039E1D1C5
MNTLPKQVVDGRRHRRLHSDEFKGNAVAACMQPGVSLAAVAMANGINANLLRRWVCAAEASLAGARPKALPAPKPVVPTAPAVFVPVQLPTRMPPCDIRVELRRGATTVTEAAHNVVMVGGPGTGKTHLAIAIGVAGIGNDAARLCQLMFTVEGRVGQRKLWGIVHLADRHPRQIVNAACAQAL